MKTKKPKKYSLFIILFAIIGQNSFAYNKGDEIKTTLAIDNDGFTNNSTDRDYTQGATISFKSLKNNKSDFFKAKDATILGVSISQFVYTPEILTKSGVVIGDRPYAGWIGASGIIASRKGNSLILYGVDIGMVGPDSYAEQTQKAWHRLIKDNTPLGWENQLNRELGVNVKFMGAKSFRHDGRVDEEIILHGGGAVGNIDIHGEVGATMRVGINVPDDLGMGIGDNSDKLSIYGLMKINQKLVIKDIFLDGNNFSKSYSVEKNMNVTVGSIGFAARYKNFEVGYTYDFISEQFKTQNGIDRRATVFLNFNKRF
jgi:hypothetical protein